MSYVDRPQNWKYNEKTRTNRNLYVSIYTNLAVREGLVGRELRKKAAEQMRKLSN